jgi:predicted Zn-dependent protease
MFKKIISVILIFFMTFMPCVYASDTLQGSVSVDIVPYCQNWTSVQAFNEINRIGTKLKLANNINEQIVFNVSEKDEANATTNINNQIDVYQGLLQYVETEDELAFVIGHEIGHVEKTHVKKTMIRNVLITTVGVAGATLATYGIAGNSAKATKSGAVLIGSSAVGALAGKKVSRNQETASDLASIDYMVNAGYNPLATISILNKISGNYFDLLSDHPSGEKRIKKAYQYISKKYPQYIDEGYNSTSYQRALSIINKEK